MRICYLAALVFWAVLPLSAQDFFNLQAPKYCQYWGDTLEQELYRFEPNESVPQAVDKILQWTGQEANFELVQCNAASVAAVLDGDKRYLLYSQDFFYHLETPLEAYALLAHEIGHHLNNHRFDSCCRKSEEYEADHFMGYVLYRSNLTDSLGSVAMADWQYEQAGFSFQSLVKDDRRQAIARGWARSDAALQSGNSLAFYENEEKARTAGLRAFPWPPPSCAERYTIGKNLDQTFSTIGDIDTWLCHALDNKEYWSRSYHYLPDGFALVTRLEQFQVDGSSVAEKYRWVDYPATAGDGGLLDYLYSIFVPRKGYFRVFVFAVTDEAAGSSGKPVRREEAQKWLENATSNLPGRIAALPVNSDHFVEVLVYEFESTDSNLKANRKCPCAQPCRVHLEKSGLMQFLK
ncbi:MAG: hypothetical protein EP344_10205 [Bacteroidetes bacterium]|nr:MAG: hypothetical protein EP344_10205 [Bacteroidota bacterium]